MKIVRKLSNSSSLFQYLSPHCSPSASSSRSLPPEPAASWEVPLPPSLRRLRVMHPGVQLCLPPPSWDVWGAAKAPPSLGSFPDPAGTESAGKRRAPPAWPVIPAVFGSVSNKYCKDENSNGTLGAIKPHLASSWWSWRKKAWIASEFPRGNWLAWVQSVALIN